MEFNEVIKRRRSIRKFTAEIVPEQTIRKAIDAALIAPNSSNLQPWEFYWVRSPDKKAKLVTACFAQGAAATAAELVVAVSRVDTWQRNRAILLKQMSDSGKVPRSVLKYYNKIVPVSYFQGPFGLLGLLKWPLFFTLGLFRPMPRGPAFRSQLFEVVTKTTALACENLMLSIVDQGFDCCPMEGFDESRVKRLLGLNRKSHVVMVIGIGKGDPAGVFGQRQRIPRELVAFEV
jgi:nitroreductase